MLIPPSLLGETWFPAGMSNTDAIWSKAVASNIIRHRSGTYYLSAMVGSRRIRKSLQTDKLAAAKIKRDEMLAELREAATAASGDIQTVGDALAMIEAQTNGIPTHKPNTKRFYSYLFPELQKTLPLGRKAGEWSKDDVKAWWADFSADRGASQSNAGLQVVKRMITAMIDTGARKDNPANGIRGKRPGKANIDQLPTLAVLDKMLAGIRATNAPNTKQSANMIEFLAFSGLRVGELNALEWKHLGKEWVTVTGGAQGTKNNLVRKVPIGSRLRALIDSMNHEGAEGPVFHIQDPGKALGTACVKASIPHMRVHDLRHWFATYSIECGVDIPTVSKWLGHKDGGVLAMKTYGHIRDEHSLASIKKLG
jgi:integrase